MKKIKAVFSVLLASAVLAAAALPVFAADTEQGGYGSYYSIANTGDTAAGTNNAFTGTQDALFGKALTYLFKSSTPGVGNVQKGISFAFDNLTAPAGTKYFVFWFGQEFDGVNDSVDPIQSDEWWLCQRFNISYRDGASTESLNDTTSWIGSNEGVSDTVYTVSTDDGTVRSRSITNGSAFTGTPSATSNWGDFKNGYVIVPVSLVAGNEVFENETVIDLRIRLADGSKYFNAEGEMIDDNNGISANTRLFIDNVGFITDADAFLADIGEKSGSENGCDVYTGSTAAYKMGRMAANGFDAELSAVLNNGTVSVSWGEVPSAEEYTVNVYSKDGKLLVSDTTAGLSYSTDGLSEDGYDVQVLALAGGSIAAVSQIKSVGALAGYYTVVNDGSDRTDVTAQGMNLSVEDKSPDGTAITGRTVLGQQSGLITDQQFVQIIYKNITVPDDAEAMVFWFGQEFEQRSDTSRIQDASATLLPKFAFTWRAGGSDGGFSAQNVNSEMYQISTDDGIAYSASFGANINGTPSAASNWVTFKNGYVIVPFSLFAKDGFGDNETVDFRIEITGAASGNGNLKYMDAEGNIMEMGKVSGNTVVTFDNFGFITDMSAFTADLGDKDSQKQKGKTVYSNASAAYKMGYMGQKGESLAADAVYKDGAVSVSWAETDGADSYDVTLYSGGTSLVTERISAPEYSFTVPKLDYVIQVIARDADGKILETSAPAAVKDGELAGDANGDYQLNIKDLVAMKKIAAGISENLYNGDMNGDEKVDSADLAMLRKVLMGL